MTTEPTTPASGGAQEPAGDAREALDPYLYAVTLAQSLREKHFPDVPQWEPLPDLYGVLTQIDNMTTALKRSPAESGGAQATAVGKVEAWLSSPAVVDFAVQYGPRCRDCADEAGFCPSTGIGCGEKRKAVQYVLGAVTYGLTHGFCPFQKEKGR